MVSIYSSISAPIYYAEASIIEFYAFAQVCFEARGTVWGRTPADHPEPIGGKQDVFGYEHRRCHRHVVWGSYTQTGAAADVVECQPFSERLG